MLPPLRSSVVATAAALAACVAVSPAQAESSCAGTAPLAGVVGDRGAAGAGATLSIVSAPQDTSSVAAWVGIAPGLRSSQRVWLRVGMRAGASGAVRIYTEVKRSGRAPHRRTLRLAVAAGERHRLAVRRVPGRPGWWRAFVDGRAVSRPISFSRQKAFWRPIAAVDGNACARFELALGELRKLADNGRWVALRGAVTSSPAAAVVTDQGRLLVLDRRTLALRDAKPDVRPAPMPALAPPGEVGAKEVPPPAPPPPPPLAPFFAGDWESGGLSPWGGADYRTGGQLADQIAVVASPVRQGRFAARFTVRPGDKYSYTSGERSEVFFTESREAEGDVRWYAWSTLFPSDWVEPRGWGIFLQWHSDFPHPPPVAFNARGDYVRLDLYSGTLSSTGAASYKSSHRLLDISKGSWNDFVARIHWSLAGGSITVWHRVEGEPTFAKRLDVAGVPTLQQKGGAVSTNYLKHGLYRADDPLVTNTIFHDGLRRGTALDDVAGAFDGPVVLAG